MGPTPIMAPDLGISALNQNDQPLKNTHGKGAKYLLWESVGLIMNVLPRGRIEFLLPR